MVTELIPNEVQDQAPCRESAPTPFSWPGLLVLPRGAPTYNCVSCPQSPLMQKTLYPKLMPLYLLPLQAPWLPLCWLGPHVSFWVCIFLTWVLVVIESTSAIPELLLSDGIYSTGCYLFLFITRNSLFQQSKVCVCMCLHV